MKNETILKKAIEKAVENEWLYFKGINKKGMCEVVYDTHGIPGMNIFLFDHSFCKAFAIYILATNQSIKLDVCATRTTGWSSDKKILEAIEKQFKINLVLAEDRLKYIEKFLK